MDIDCSAKLPRAAGKNLNIVHYLALSPIHTPPRLIGMEKGMSRQVWVEKRVCNQFVKQLNGHCVCALQMGFD
jgi:hypothetical protein